MDRESPAEVRAPLDASGKPFSSGSSCGSGGVLALPTTSFAQG